MAKRASTKYSESKKKRSKREESLSEIVQESKSVPNDERKEKDEEGLKTEVEEEEEEEENEDIDEEGSDSDSDLDSDSAKNNSDPFKLHFSKPSSTKLSESVNTVKSKGWTTNRIKPSEDSGYSLSIQSASEHGIQAEISCHNITLLEKVHVKRRLVEPFIKLNKRYTSKTSIFSDLQEDLAEKLFSYRDVLYSPESFYNNRQIQYIYTLHILNHVFKTRDLILKNNIRLAKHVNDDEPVELRDQGFTRPKVLVLLPTRESAYKFLQTIVQLCGSQPENMKRLQNEYHSDSLVSDKKPEDFRAFFSGNNDDNFRLGVKFTRKTVKLFTEFYKSDLIVASPLGLRLIVGDKTDRKRDFDFLSSIEVVVADQLNSLAMQNWDHILHIFNHINLIPQDAHGCDFSRIRNWYLDAQSKYLRQTLLFTEFITPEINALYTHQMSNIAGKVKYLPSYVGVLGDVGGSMTHVFMKFYSTTPQEDPDKRFKQFTTKSLPSLMRQSSASSAGTIIVVPSYVDYVRVRNYFEQEHQIGKKLGSSGFEFVAINEYTSTSELTRSRALFREGKVKIMLYTERLHYFRRYEIKGAETVFMYGLPDNPNFYTEIARFLVKSVSDRKVEQSSVSVRTLFSKWDAFKLERVVGSARVAKMIAGAGEVFEFS
ncbi:uncharacterized protein V1516DRAFT_686040 [Lipomyces oligophaga]|uniref:uncharacterized protein n=1 Tax=Lipomyces oligophaga TaxID=45792 RepID=UPI0034CD5966